MPKPIVLELGRAEVDFLRECCEEALAKPRDPYDPGGPDFPREALIVRVREKLAAAAGRVERP
jgi:hypothetical protein